MIVVAIVAILAVIVVPSYQSYVLKARRTDAKAALTTAAQMLERYATEHPKDGYKVLNLGNAGVPDKSENGHYELKLVNAGFKTELDSLAAAKSKPQTCRGLGPRDPGINALALGSIERANAGVASFCRDRSAHERPQSKRSASGRGSLV